MVFIYNLFKTIKYQSDTKIDHSFFKKIALNSIITNVVIGRKTNVKILRVTEWIRIKGCKLELSQNQKDPKQYFLKGDSIIKKKRHHFYNYKKV